MPRSIPQRKREAKENHRAEQSVFNTIPAIPEPNTDARFVSKLSGEIKDREWRSLETLGLPGNRDTHIIHNTGEK